MWGAQPVANRESAVCEGCHEPSRTAVARCLQGCGYCLDCFHRLEGTCLNCQGILTVANSADGSR
jgi:hypothetical protein